MAGAPVGLATSGLGDLRVPLGPQRLDGLAGSVTALEAALREALGGQA